MPQTIAPIILSRLCRRRTGTYLNHIRSHSSSRAGPRSTVAQADRGCHAALSRSMALRVVIIFRMTATMMTLDFLSASARRLEKALRAGSASIASRVQVRATSRRISRTRELGADSAHCRHSAARSLHFSGLSIATPSGGPPIRKIKPRLDRGDQRGFLRSASAGAKLFSKLGTYLIVPRYLTASTKNFFAFGLSSVSRHDKLL